MKRLHILFGLTLVCLSMPNVVWGKEKGCTKTFACDHNADGWGRQAYVPKIQGSETQCWGCGKEEGMCDTGQVVPQKKPNGEIVALYQCDRNGFLTKNTFDEFTPDIWCKNSDIILRALPSKTTEKNFTKTLDNHPFE